ncbi:transferase [candidate division WS5 bacterium]|uniref:Transferase n=1 Tax=candidate division WS5 bacterium TaxID=2093353 RepID=A0A419DFC9_9BACT|nr:MAG: transferase [candidate division WS5 bacterium]
MEQGKFCDIADDFKHGKNFKCGVFVKIDKDVVVGDDVTIENFVLLRSGTRIGDNVIVEDYGMILSGSRIGDGCKIGTYTKVGQNVTIGDNCQFTSFCEIRDKCKLGNNVAMGSRGTLSAGTIVEDEVIMKYSFVVTDTPVLSRGKEKKVGTLKRGSMFGANVCIMPGVNVGEYAEIGACSQVRHDVPANEIWYGNPACIFKKREI